MTPVTPKLGDRSSAVSGGQANEEDLRRETEEEEEWKGCYANGVEVWIKYDYPQLKRQQSTLFGHVARDGCPSTPRKTTASSAKPEGYFWCKGVISAKRKKKINHNGAEFVFYVEPEASEVSKTSRFSCEELPFIKTVQLNVNIEVMNRDDLFKYENGFLLVEHLYKENGKILPRGDAQISEDVHDLIHLYPLNEPSLLSTVSARYSKDQIYTFVGENTLISVNPYKCVTSKYYAPNLIQSYCSCVRSEGVDAFDALRTKLSPHIFTIAGMAYKNMINGLGEYKNQSIIVSGESGAGKTVSTKHMMHFLTAVAGALSLEIKETEIKENGNHCVASTEENILGSNPILEAFGNAKTLRNSNSSRFGKYVKLFFDKSWRISGAKITTYLLEKSRVVLHSVGERNYHIFYQLLFGAAGAGKGQKWHLGEGPKVSDFHYLSQGIASNEPAISESHGDSVHYYSSYLETEKAIRNLGLQESEERIWAVLSAILLIGNINDSTYLPGEIVSPSKLGSPVRIDDGPSSICSKAAELLKVDCVELKKCLVSKQIHAAKGEVIVKPFTNTNDFIAGRDSLAKFLYRSLFDWLVDFINSKLNGKDSGDVNTEDSVFIGLLDIYGFEVFEKNSLEQLCINYANEKLQQQYVNHMFVIQQREYINEGIQWDKSACTFYDNNECVKLIEDPRTGFFSMLDEECQLNRVGSSHSSLFGSNQSLRSATAESGDGVFLDKVGPRLEEKYEHFSMPKIRNSSSSAGNFFVRHFAGSVNYDVADFMEKNRDRVPQEHIDLLQGSGCEFIRRAMSRSTPMKEKALASTSIPLHAEPIMEEDDNPRSQFKNSSSGSSMNLIATFETPSRVKRTRRNTDSSLLPKPSPSSQENKLRGERNLNSCFSSASSSSSSLSNLSHSHNSSKKSTLVSIFKESLLELVKCLNSSQPYYVRCIKPNLRQVHNSFKEKTVLQQLTASGVLETAFICSKGYSCKVEFSKFFDTYGILGNHFTHGGRPSEPFKGNDSGIEIMWKERVEKLLDSFPPFLKEDIALGKTKLFCKNRVLVILDKELKSFYDQRAILIQKNWKGLVCKRRYNRIRLAVLRLQYFRKTMVTRKLFLEMRTSSLRIQSLFRMHVCRTRWNALRSSAVKIQKIGRCWCERRRFLVYRSSALTIQKTFRCWRERKRFLIYRKSVVKIQCCVRRFLSMKALETLRWLRTENEANTSVTSAASEEPFSNAVGDGDSTEDIRNCTAPDDFEKANMSEQDYSRFRGNGSSSKEDKDVTVPKPSYGKKHLFVEDDPDSGVGSSPFYGRKVYKYDSLSQCDETSSKRTNSTSSLTSSVSYSCRQPTLSRRLVTMVSKTAAPSLFQCTYREEKAEVEFRIVSHIRNLKDRPVKFHCRSSRILRNAIQVPKSLQGTFKGLRQILEPFP
eukprot:Nk52_evm21s156 gene=Nk52_evmTU21s156